MTIRALQALALGLSLLAACTNSAPAVIGQSAVGVDLGSSGRVPSSRIPREVSMNHAPDRAASGNVELVHDGHSDAHAVGVVNSVDASQHKINLTHEPIPSLGWPSMTMEFPVAPSVNLNGVKPGARVNFTIEKGNGGMYQVQSVQPAGQR